MNEKKIKLLEDTDVYSQSIVERLTSTVKKLTSAVENLRKERDALHNYYKWANNFIDKVRKSYVLKADEAQKILQVEGIKQPHLERICPTLATRFFHYDFIHIEQASKALATLDNKHKEAKQ